MSTLLILNFDWGVIKLKWYSQNINLGKIVQPPKNARSPRYTIVYQGTPWRLDIGNVWKLDAISKHWHVWSRRWRDWRSKTTIEEMKRKVEKKISVNEFGFAVIRKGITRGRRRVRVGGIISWRQYRWGWWILDNTVWKYLYRTCTTKEIWSWCISLEDLLRARWLVGSQYRRVRLRSLEIFPLSVTTANQATASLRGDIGTDYTSKSDLQHLLIAFFPPPSFPFSFGICSLHDLFFVSGCNDEMEKKQWTWHM